MSSDADKAKAREWLRDQRLAARYYERSLAALLASEREPLANELSDLKSGIKSPCSDCMRRADRLEQENQKLREALQGMLDYAEDVRPELLVAALHGATGTDARRARNTARFAAASAALGKS